ncbi:MAG: FadR/GntR family transcriptional regulator [Spirochaetales bacterium]
MIDPTVNKQGPIDKKSIVDQVMERIISNIIDGTYPPGTKLPNEYELMSVFGISRNSIREAIKILVAMGILEIKRGDGTYVCSQINPSMFDRVVYSMISGISTGSELLELRQVLDESTVRMATHKITADEITALKDNIGKMQKAFSDGEIELAREYDFDFHMMLIEACKNTFFSRLVKGVYGIFYQSIGDTVKAEKIESKADIYHAQMLDCVINKDFEKIHRVVCDSLSTWRKHINGDRIQCE